MRETAVLLYWFRSSRRSGGPIFLSQDWGNVKGFAAKTFPVRCGAPFTPASRGNPPQSRPTWNAEAGGWRPYYAVPMARFIVDPRVQRTPIAQITDSLRDPGFGRYFTDHMARAV